MQPDSTGPACSAMQESCWVCWVWVCQESLLHEWCCWLCLGHLCPEPLTALGEELHQAEQAAARDVCVPSLPNLSHAEVSCSPACAFPACGGSAEGLTLPASLCPRPSVRVETQPALDLQHYRDSHSGPLQYIFWRQMLRSICPGEHIAVRDGCAGCGGPGMLCRGNMQLVKCHA